MTAASKKKLIYLAGGMEKRADNGKTWRRLITPKLEKIGYAVFNPCLEEGGIFKNYNITPEELKKLEKSKNVEFFMKMGNDIGKHDLKAIEASDFVIVFMDESVFKSSGTVSEMTIAKLVWDKPVFVIRSVPYSAIPLWTFGCVTKFFNCIDDCVQYLKLYPKLEAGHKKSKEEIGHIVEEAERKRSA